MSTIRTVGIVGTGVIGSSWVALFLAHGLQVLVSDPAPGAEQKLVDFLARAWPALSEIGLAPNASLTNYRFVGASLADHYADVDFIQENAPERVELKSKIIAEMDAGTRPDVIIASSSSGIPSSQFIGLCTKAPERVLIGHPFSPPHLMPLVEIVPHPKTANASIDKAIEFYNLLGRKPVLMKQEIPGFVTNRLQAAVWNEAYSLVSRGVISAADLDTCMTNSLGPRWSIIGPFASNSMAGGGGSAGFEHFYQHLGPATKNWLNDMDANRFDWSLKSLDSLVTSVESIPGKGSDRDINALQKERDELLIKVLRLKNTNADKTS